MARQSIWFLLTVILLSFSCSVLKKEDPEQNVRAFIQKFEQSLTGDEKSVLELFDTPQSRESILSAISVLQSKETKLIECKPAFASASVSFEEETVKITIPVKFESKNAEFEYKEETNLFLWLKPRQDSYVISKLGAESFYETFAKIKNEMKWEVEREQAFAEREKHYAIARTLQTSFDSVVWFTTYNNKPYYYVVTGQWTNYVRNYERGTNKDVAMGIVDGDGKVVVPQEFDLVGTLGFNFSGLVEVKKNNKSGYFDIENGKLVVPAQYDVIIPYGKKNVLCVVKNDQTYGYYNFFHEYKEGFPSEEVKEWVDNFMFIPEKLQLKKGVQALCEIPAREHAGFGIVIPPSYLVRTGIFNEVIGGITTTEFPLEGWTDYLETEGTVSQRVSESLLAFVTTIRERYLEGRQEFYSHSKVIFVGPGHDTLKVGDIPAGETTIRKLDSLIEVKYVYPTDYYYEEMSWPDIVPGYVYFAVSEDLTITPKKTLRSFAETQFVKLDSTYFTGKFSHNRYDSLLEEPRWVTDEINFISQPTIKYMRDEILASYGVKIENSANANFYVFENVPAVTRSEAEQLFSEIDRHNVQFLETLLGESAAVVVQ